MKKWILLSVFLCLAAAAAGLVHYFKSANDLHNSSRTRWKTKALVELTAKAVDTAAISNQITMARTNLTGPYGSEKWMTRSLIVMTNAEWMLYSATGQKENFRIQDIFIGRGSNGKWYYSTYHFCIDMFEVRTEDQPDSIQNFVKAYYLKEFDGRSEICLESTWPPPKGTKK